MAESVAPVEAFNTAMAERDIAQALELYAPDAEVVRFEGVATGHNEIQAFLVGFLSSYENFDLVNISQLQRAGDVIVWDSTHATGLGMLQMTTVFLLNGDGLITRHVPIVRGYWGKT